MDAEFKLEFAANRRSWDERTPLHLASPFYDVPGVLAGRSTLHPFEVDELGTVDGMDLVHLQCHFGLDTISWARQGARVTGLDFSAPAIAAAKELATQCGIDEARFEVANVYEAPEVLGATYDVVYTGLGALNWLPDLNRWARVVSQLLRPGGRFYLLEFHPLLWTLSEAGPTFDPRYSYFFDPAGVLVEDASDYADPDAALAASSTYEWAHPLSEVLTALIEVGLELRWLHEHEVIAYRPWEVLEAVPGEAMLWRLAQGQPQIPLDYSVLAVKP
jgi:SAM-dependent methyltransferase